MVAKAHPENLPSGGSSKERSPLSLEVHRETLKPVVIITGRGVSRPLTRAAQFACSGYSKTAREKVMRWLRAYLATWPDTPDITVNESLHDATTRFQTFMQSRGCTFENPKGVSRANGLILIRRAGKDLTEPSLFINALEAFYRHFSQEGLRHEPNPMLMPDWEILEPNNRAGIMRRQNQIRRLPTFRGLRYIVEQRETFKPKLYNPAGVRDRIFNAGAEWPETVKTLFRVIADSGCRISEPLQLTAQDWWDGSQFGDVIRAPNKSSDGKRVKDLLIDAATVDRIRASFAGSGRGYARRPSMEELVELSRSEWRGRMELLLLFPQENGRPHTAGSLRDTYFTPAVRQARIMLEGNKGRLEYVTPHVLRHARIDEEIRLLDALHPEQEPFIAELEDFARHMHCTIDNIMDYAAGALRQRSLRYRRKLMQARVAMVENTGPGQALTATQHLVGEMSS